MRPHYDKVSVNEWEISYAEIVVLTWIHQKFISRKFFKQDFDHFDGSQKACLLPSVSQFTQNPLTRCEQSA